MSDKTLQVLRERLPTGGKASFQDYIDTLTEALKVRPLTPSEMGLVIGKTREWTQKKFITYMQKEGMIKQVEGSHAYQLSNHNMNVKQLHQVLASESEFYQCATIQRWTNLKGSKKSTMTKITIFKRICLGKYGNFKLNPDLWVHDRQMVMSGKLDTTKQCIEMLRDHYGKDRLNSNVRGALRAFILYGLGKQFPEEDGLMYGIDGGIDKPKVADLALTKEQYEEGKKNALKVGEKYGKIYKFESYSGFTPAQLFKIKFGVWFWSGVRPSTLYTIECDSLEFYDRHVKYIEVKGKKITEEDTIELVRDKFEVQEYTHRACHFKVVEHKTSIAYDKYIYDEEIVKMLEKLVQARKKDGFKHIFWDDNIEFQFETYDKIVKNRRNKDNKAMKEVLQALDQPLLAIKRALYALRHYSIQMWLSHTDYDYGFVVEMFHESIDILRKWYGRFTRAKFESKVREVIF